jgi:hypothetical protein
MVETTEPFKLHPTFMSYIYGMIEHLQLLGMGIWLLTHSVVITDVILDLGSEPKV